MHRLRIGDAEPRPRATVFALSAMLVVSSIGAAGSACAEAPKAKAPGQPKVEVPSVEAQIKQALLAAPTDRREAATVLGYTTAGALETLRKGTNDLVCVADNPHRTDFKVSCHHQDLEPYMARGRALRATGINGQDNLKARWKEIDAGKLEMPKTPRTLYVLHGEGYDSAKGEIVKPYLRWVIYTPYATPASTGLSTEASPSAPWLMFPGTAGAHIMINPPKS